MEADGSGGGATEGLAGRPAMRGRGGAVDEDPVRLPRLLDEAEWLDVEGAMPTIVGGVVGFDEDRSTSRHGFTDSTGTEPSAGRQPARLEG